MTADANERAPFPAGEHQSYAWEREGERAAMKATSSGVDDGVYSTGLAEDRWRQAQGALIDFV